MSRSALHLAPQSAHTNTAASLCIGPAHDAYEDEANQAAERVNSGENARVAWSLSRVVLGPMQRECSCGGTCDDCKNKGEMLQRQATSSAAVGSPAPASVSSVLSGPGSALDGGTRSFMESRFGYDFSRVRIHADSQAAESAREVSANAYTVGSSIVFSQGKYQPHSLAGRRLLAHEPAHVVQQRRSVTALRRSPLKQSEQQDVNVAKQRGQLMARRVRHHGKLSKEARDKINHELAYFEGSAKDAYLKEIKPALREVVEIEMPAADMSGPILPPAPISLLPLDESPTLCGGQKCLTDQDLGIKEPRDRETQETQLRLDLNLAVLNKQISDWLPGDQEFATTLVTAVINNHINPKRVAEVIRKPILDRYEAWMRLVDKKRAEMCDPNRGGIETARATASNDDPCKSWFSPESGHAAHELSSLESLLKITADKDATPSDSVYWSVFEYRKLTDPKMLEQAEMAGAMVGAFVAIVDGVNAQMRSSPTKLAIGGGVEPPVNAGGGANVSRPPEAPVAPRVDPPITAPDPPPQPAPQVKVADPPALATAGVQGDLDTALGKGSSKKAASKSSIPSVKDDATSAKKQSRKDTSAKAKATTPRETGKAEAQERERTSGKSKEDTAGDIAKIKKLNEWEKNNKVLGEVQGLRNRLLSKDPDTAASARKEFDEIEQQVKNGEKPEIEPYKDDPRATQSRQEQITDSSKKELQDSLWLRKRLEDEDDRQSFMDGLKADHKAGDLGQEIDMKKKGQEGHKGSHLDPYPGSPEAEEALFKWHETTGRPVNWQPGDEHYVPPEKPKGPK